MAFNDSIYSNILAELPAQMIPLSEKDEAWKKRNMDALESVGRAQYVDNIKLIENYEMVKGRFIYSHYFEKEGYTDFIAQLTREFELPSYLRHYDIISQVINTLSGEWQKRPDVFRVKNFSEDATNEFERTKTDLLHKYVQSKLEAEIVKRLYDQGLDPQKNDFESEEEQMQYQQILENARKALTPPEIEEYMSTQWTQQAEIWGQHQIELDKQRFNLKEKEKEEFEDMLVADRCFRHFYLTANGYSQETWNPIHVFFHKSPETKEVENGDYVGRCFYLTAPAIIDRYGHIMKKDQIQVLQNGGKKEDRTKWNYAPGTEYVYNEYLMPFKGFQGYDIANKTAPVPFLQPNDLEYISSGRALNERKGLYLVTEAYWKSQEKIGKITYIDENGVKTSKFVDENVVIPEGFVQKDSSFEDSDEVNTVVWTWVNRVWKGIKINLKGTSYGKDIYLDVRPVDFQFKGDINPYNAKLPVCGQMFSVRNSKSMSLVDLMKPYQIFYNVVMNQLYQIAEREIGRFIVMDVNMFPDVKDWGGENAWEKFMLVAKSMGVGLADTSPTNLKGAVGAAGGYLPKDFNFDDSARMMSRITLAEKFEQLALRQVGFNQYRLGTFSAESTAAGVAAGQEKSYSQTETYFTNFSNYLRRCYEMNLAIAQFTQSQNKDVTVMYTKSDMSRAFIKLAGTDILLADLHVGVTNSLEYIRQTETLRQLALNNNTSGANILDLSEIITSNSPEAIKVKLKESVKKQEELQNRNYQLEQEKLAFEKEKVQAELAQKEDHFTRTLENNLDEAYIREGSKIISSEPTQPTDNGRELAQQNAAQKNQLQQQKQLSESDYKLKKLALEQGKINAQLQIQNKELEYARIMKGKEDKK